MIPIDIINYFKSKKFIPLFMGKDFIPPKEKFFLEVDILKTKKILSGYKMAIEKVQYCTENGIHLKSIILTILNILLNDDKMLEKIAFCSNDILESVSMYIKLSPLACDIYAPAGIKELEGISYFYLLDYFKNNAEKICITLCDDKDENIIFDDENFKKFLEER